MERESRNIYYNARRSAGLTQERWAEQIGCSVESVRNYEAGTQIPSDELVIAMTEVSAVPPLGYWHLRRKSTLAHDALPEVEHVPLPQAVLQLLAAMEDFSAANQELIRVAADGRISTDELAVWQQLRLRLDAVIRAAMTVRYSEGGG